MSEHTHLSGIEVDGDNIRFSFARHTDPPIAGMNVPQDHNAALLAAQLQRMGQLGLLAPEQLQAVVSQPEMERLAELYKPEPKTPQSPPPGHHTANYLAQQAAASGPGQNL